MKRWVWLGIISLCSLLIQYSDAASVPRDEVLGERLVKAKSVVISAPRTTRSLVTSKEVSPSASDLIAEADHLFRKQPVLALLLLEENRIVFERYKDPATASTAFLGYSMSKSVTSLAIGRALCEGLIKSLDDRAVAYVGELAGTVYANATVNHLLMMASGASHTAPSGWQRRTMGRDIVMARISMLEGIKEFGEPQQGLLGPVKPGDEFVYKNNDTNVLALILEASLGKPFAGYFADTIWRDVGAESQAHWTVDKDGRFGGWAGFHATLRDWGRLALYILEKTRTPSGDCFEDYVKRATSSRIRNSLKLTGQSFGGYGFQFWTDNRFNSRATFWLVGIGGQRIGIDPNTKRMVVVFSSSSDVAIDVYRLLGSWQRL